MSTSLTSRVVVALLLLASALPAWPQADGSLPSNSLETCRRALGEAGAAVARMPDGVEKAAAQKEASAAKDDMANGDTVGCNTHAKNAMQAARTKSAS